MRNMTVWLARKIFAYWGELCLDNVSNMNKYCFSTDQKLLNVKQGSMTNLGSFSANFSPVKCKNS